MVNIFIIRLYGYFILCLKCRKFEYHYTANEVKYALMLIIPQIYGIFGTTFS